jgi:ATP-dependent helicase/nuclease subunit A
MSSQQPTTSLLIYNSSAGSGKTYTLVMEYLKLVLNRPWLFRSILAITFTNKATAEMKERIIEALSGLANETDARLLESVRKATGLSDPVIAERAQHTLAMILHDYSGFSVSTIDSFFAKLVRSMSRELQLTFGYNLELDTTAVIDEITKRLFDDISKDRQLREWLMAYVMDKIESEKPWTIDDEVHNISRTLFTEEFRTIFPDGDIKPIPSFIDALKAIINSFNNQLRHIGSEFVAILDREGLAQTDFFHNGSGYLTVFTRIAEKGYYENMVFGARYIQLMNDPTKWSNGKSTHKVRIKSLAEDELIPLAQQLKSYFDTNFKQFISAKSVMDFAFMSGIIGALDDKLRDFRAEENMVMLSDHNLLLRRSMENNDTEFIYEKTGNRYSHFMLDEFQDTSGFQWNNLFPLIQNALSQGQYTLIVGDPKQSIYRWRGSNMELLRKNVLDDLSAYRQFTRLEKLSTNYRSLQRIIAFNNRFFVNASTLFFPQGAQLSNGHPYEQPTDVEQASHHGNDGQGFIRFKFMRAGNEEEQDSESENENGNGNEEEDLGWMEQSDQETLSTIRDLLQKGFRYCDIAILVRNNSHAQRIAGYLVFNGINQITSAESMQLNRSERINMLINLFRILVNPDDKIALAQVLLNNPFADPNQTDNQKLSVRLGNRLSALPKMFLDEMPKLKRLPLFEAFERIATIFRMHEHPDAYLQRFADVILEFTSKQPVGISDFLEWWEENQFRESCSVITPSGLNSIRIMTIHKSKGLQFPVVIMPYTSWKAESDHKSSIWVHSDQEPFDCKPAHIVKVKKTLSSSFFEPDYTREIMTSRLDNMNLLYVAFTRAEEQLYVFCKNFKSKTEPKWSSETAKIIYKVLKHDADWSSILTANDEMLFEWGDATGPIKNQKDPGVVPEPLREWISEPWQERIRMLINKDRIASSDKQRPDPTYGIHFHALAASADGTSDADTLVQTYCKQHPMEDAHRTRLLKDMQLFLTTATQYGWFDLTAETCNETELMLPDGKVMRPDRLVLKGTKAIVVDYKTGDEDASHEKQVKAYGDVLKQMGYSETQLFLFYPMLEKTKAVA